MGEISSLSTAIFIDRDGVILHNNPHYVRSLSQAKIYPQAILAIVSASTDYKIVIISNQAGVGKGLYTLETANEINQEIVRNVEKAGGKIDGVYVCPHKIEDNCECRKPKPGLIYRAAHDLSIDLANSFMIGDSLSDIIAGQQAGVKQCILVLTGRGKAQRELVKTTEGVSPFWVRKTLMEAINTIRGKNKR